jgi:hypothetical protein
MTSPSRARFSRVISFRGSFYQSALRGLSGIDCHCDVGCGRTPCRCLSEAKHRVLVSKGNIIVSAYESARCAGIGETIPPSQLSYSAKPCTRTVDMTLPYPHPLIVRFEWGRLSSLRSFHKVRAKDVKLFILSCHAS